MNLMRTQYVDRAVNKAKSEIRNHNYDLAWKYREEAHIFSQPDAGMHFYVHWEMLSLAIKERNMAEILGQALRLFIAVPSSILRLYPAGNNGRSKIGLFSPMPLSKNHEKKLRELENLENRRIENGGELPKYQRKHPLTRR